MRPCDWCLEDQVKSYARSHRKKKDVFIFKNTIENEENCPLREYCPFKAYFDKELTYKEMLKVVEEMI